MTAITEDLYVEQGATFYHSFQVLTGTYENGVVVPGPPLNLTGCTARTQIRPKQGSAPQFSASNTAASPAAAGHSGFLFGITATGQDTDAPDLTNGWLRLRITDADTDLIQNKACVYDIELVHSSGRVYRLKQGKVTTDPNITQDPDDPVEV